MKVNRGDLLTKFLDPERHCELVSELPLSVPSARRGKGVLAAASLMALLPKTAAAADGATSSGSQCCLC